MAKKSEDRVRITLKYEFKSEDKKEAYLARILRKGIYIDDRKITKLTGLALAEHLILRSAQELDPTYLQDDEDLSGAVTVRVNAEQPHRSGAEAKKPETETREEKISALGLKNLIK